MEKYLEGNWAKVLATVISLALLYLAFVNPRFDRLDGRFDRLEDKVDANIAAIIKLDGNIDAVGTKFDNKFENLADTMITAHTNEGASEAELVAIWKRVADESEADESE